MTSEEGKKTLSSQIDLAFSVEFNLAVQVGLHSTRICIVGLFIITRSIARIGQTTCI